MHLEAPQAPPRLWRISRKGAGGERDGTDDPVHDDKSFTGERIPTVKRRRANKTWRRGRERGIVPLAKVRGRVKPGICRAIHISTSFSQFRVWEPCERVRYIFLKRKNIRACSMYWSKESRDIIRFKKYKINKNICMTLYEWIFHSINKLKIVFLDVSIKKITFNPPLIPNISRKFSLRISYRIPLFKNRSSSKKKVSSMEITHCFSKENAENWAMNERKTHKNP